MTLPKIVTYISNKREKFTATVIGDRGEGHLNLEIKRPGGRTQRIFNVPKKDTKQKEPKFYWFATPEPKPTPEPKNS